MQNLTLFVAPEPNGSNATEEAAPVAKTNIRFPGRFEFEAKTRIGVLHKLEFVDHVREGTVTPYNRSRTEGYMFATGGQQTFITQKPTTAALSADDIRQVAVFGNLDSTIAALEAGAGRWLRPRPRTLLDQTIDESERRCVQIVETWKDRFALREEREEGGALIPGLRRPQVGAVYATLAHWSVTEAPATIVMPTGTGKTETMLALLVCARLPKRMVIVPTSALPDQL